MITVVCFVGILTLQHLSTRCNNELKTMITVRTRDGKIRQLSLHGPPLCLRPTSIAATLLPGDVLRRIFCFLSPTDWLAADITCRAWQQAAIPLWSRQKRCHVAAQYAAMKRVQRQWQRLHGFVRHVSLYGPATADDLQALQRAVAPLVIPYDLLASLQIHDGQGPRGCGLYGAARLLSIREILHELSLVDRRVSLPPGNNNNNNPHHHPSSFAIAAADDDDDAVMRLPLFSAVGCHQIVMELQETCNNNNSDSTHHGRIVLVVVVTGAAPPLRVLARTWHDFLTLV